MSMFLLATAASVWAGVASVAAVLLFRELRRAQARCERLKEEALKEMISPAYLSHEIRTPLTIINGACELLDEDTGELSPVQRDFVRTIRSNSRAAVELAEDFLTYYTLEKSLLNLHLRKENIRLLVREAVQEFRLMHVCDVRLDNHGAPQFVDADERMLKQALWNLFINAVRHGGSDVAITVTVAALDGTVVLHIEDNGPGMPPPVQSHILSRDLIRSTSGQDTAKQSHLDRRPSQLTRGVSTAENGSPASEKLPTAGSGIGMEIVERIIRAHHGRLLTDSIPGKGTRILVELPLTGESLAT